MSADNGVYILQTKGPEFRVTYAQAIDNIFGKLNDQEVRWEGNPDQIKNYFGKCPVFDNREDAMNCAKAIAHKYDYLEDGICSIDEFREMDFPA